MKIIKFFVALSCIFFISCVKDIDLNQVDDIEIYTDHNASLVYFTLDASKFLNDFGEEKLQISDATRMPIFSGLYTGNFLIQADFKFKLSNTFSRKISTQLELFDTEGNSVYLFESIDVLPFSNNIEVTQIIDEADIKSVLLTDKFVVNILMDSGNTPLDPINKELFSLQSAVILHYKVTAQDE